MIAANLLEAKWIGNLTNQHEKSLGDQSNYFGLTYPECTYQMLNIHHLHQPEKFILVPQDVKDIFKYVSEILRVVEKKTVVAFNWQRLDQSHNFAVFNNKFRERFHQQRDFRKDSLQFT